MRFILTTLIALFSFNCFATKTIKLTEKNTVNFNQPFRRGFIAVKKAEILMKHHSLPFHKPIYIVLSTPGGSVYDGMSFISFINSLPRRFHTITNFAASMGYQTVQGVKGKRYILSHGRLMSHRGSVSGISGQVPGEAVTRLKSVLSTLREMSLMSSKRVGISVRKYNNLIQNELWLTAKQAVQLNHADEIVNAVCDRTLLATEVIDVRSFFGTMSVEFSKCPLIMAPLSIKVKRSFGYKKKTIVEQYLKSLELPVMEF